MNTYARISLKIIVIINLIMIAPGIVGLCISFVLLKEMPLYGLVSFISIAFGIINACHLFQNIKTKLAWQYNLYISIWSIVIWTFVFLIAGEGFWSTGFWALYIWPLNMVACSLYVLNKEKVKQSVFNIN